MKYIFIEKTAYGYEIEAKNYKTGETFDSRLYIGYTKADALKDYKAEHNLKGYKVI